MANITANDVSILWQIKGQLFQILCRFVAYRVTNIMTNNDKLCYYLADSRALQVSGYLSPFKL